MTNKYKDFVRSKRISAMPSGFDVRRSSIHSKLFDWQGDIVHWGLKKGKCAFFEDCGLGKTYQQCEWGYRVSEHESRPVLAFAPLAVSMQTQREAAVLGYQMAVCRSQDDVQPGLNIANYEMISHFDPSQFAGIILDESSILKGDGPLRKAITGFAARIPYRLACTATPAPNDYMELGNHAEFLGIMSKTEMLAMFFVHDGGETSKWRVKKHAEADFWKWVASWAVMIRRPSDLGYDDSAFVLPRLHYHQHTVPCEWSENYLFPIEAKTLRERQQARRDSLDERVKLSADLVNSSNDQWLLWCNLNEESEKLASLIGDAVEVTGSDDDQHKEQAPLRFIDGEIRVLVSKPTILGWGMNFQCCSHAASVGLSDSWESLYQVVRRIWRFGQCNECHMHLITGELEGAVVRNIERKERDAAAMAEAMVAHMREINTAEIRGTVRETENYQPRKKLEVPAWL
jgi:hypothetical protein